jgi:chromatin modification-related protein VID21
MSLTSCSGHTFNEASIPSPTLPLPDDATTQTKLNRASQQPAGASKTVESATTLAKDAVAASPTYLDAATQLLTSDVDSSQPQALPQDTYGAAIPETYTQLAALEPDGPVAIPSKIAPPEPEEEANFDDATEQLLDLDSPQRPAKVVRLPNEDAQEQTDQDESRRKSDESDQTKVSRNHLQAQGEAASSPSSTVGPYSAATPMPPQDSPDTSPDSETGEQIEVLPPKDLRPSPEEQRQKEEHDRLLEAQKELARRQALGDVSTPDEQLRWEVREAAARDAEERAAREDAGGPEPDVKRQSEETEAQEVVDEVMRKRDEEKAETATPAEDSKVETQPSLKDEHVEPPAAQEDGDNITVAPRNRASLTIDTSRLQSPSTSIHQPSADQDRMTTRTSSGVLQKRTVSEILGQTPTHAGPSRRNVASPDTISPMTLRHPQDTPAGPSSTFETPRRPSKQPGLPRTPSNSKSALEELMALKGAAEDPDKDYLEPLFRIQAHDSPNVRTTSLAELVRSASKTISTEDQFLTLQERLDYRILRRIYQLQNANKWSLRQMERCKEPEQPVTHHDHMMAEMKWMRKDFKAERKMKVSVCAWLARRCADWVAASSEGRKKMQIKARPSEQRKSSAESSEEQPPELEHSSESAGEDEAGPPTPQGTASLPTTLIVPPELSERVTSLQKAGKLRKALDSLPVTGFAAPPKQSTLRSLSPVSKFVHGKVLPRSTGPNRKRSRFEYEDDSAVDEEQPSSKRLRDEQNLPPDDQESALFHHENKHIRDRLHANNAFRPPSEFVMPSTQFYEFRSGSQWVWEDDQRLRKLAKEYSFNWSLIADELQLPTAVKSSAERRTPWECFERWVELEQLPTEMKKTVYFKTWFQRLEQSFQAAERRYQAHVAAIQAQNNGQINHVPLRKKTTPSRVEKRRNTRYLWLVDAIRKGARKKEQAAYKQAEGTKFSLLNV